MRQDPLPPVVPRPFARKTPLAQLLDRQNEEGGRGKKPGIADADLVFPERVVGQGGDEAAAAGVGGLKREIQDAGGIELLRKKDEIERKRGNRGANRHVGFEDMRGNGEQAADRRPAGNQRPAADPTPAAERRPAGNQRPAADPTPAAERRPALAPRPAGNQRPAGDPSRAAGPSRAADRRRAADQRPVAADPSRAADQRRLEAEGVTDLTLELLKSLKDNQLSDDELMEMCGNAIEQIKSENIVSPDQDDSQKIILNAFQLRDVHDKSILDYCAIHNKPALLALIISAIPNVKESSAFTTGHSGQSPYTYAVVNNSLEFLEYLFDTNIPIKEMSGGRNIFHVLLSNSGFFYQKSIYELSEEEIDTKLKIAQLLLNKADLQLLNANDSTGLTPIHYLYRYGSPKFISKFKDIVAKEIDCDIGADAKSNQIFNQIIGMDRAGTQIPNKNSRIIDLIKLDGVSSEIMLKGLLANKGRPYFEIKDGSGNSLLDLIQQDEELIRHIEIFQQSPSTRNPSTVSATITSGNSDNKTIWENWKSFPSEVFGSLVETMPLDTFFRKSIGEMSIFQHAIIDQKSEFAKIIIDKIDNLHSVIVAEKSLSDSLFLLNLTEQNAVTTISDVKGFLKDKKDSLTPRASCISCFTSLINGARQPRN